jgi:hypothetical protein
VNASIPVKEPTFEREGLAWLKALLEEVSFVKDVKVRAHPAEYGLGRLVSPAQTSVSTKHNHLHTSDEVL